MFSSACRKRQEMEACRGLPAGTIPSVAKVYDPRTIKRDMRGDHLISYRIYMSSLKSIGQARRYMLQWSLMFRLFGAKSGRGVGNYCTSHGVRIWCVLAHNHLLFFSASRSEPYKSYIAHVVTGEVDIRNAVCTVCVYDIVHRFQPKRWCNHLPQPISDGHRPVS